MTTEIVIAQTTVDAEDKAEALAHGAVDARLAACAHVDPPIKAFYRWQGEVQTDREWRISYKTTRSRLPELTAWVSAAHSYDVPEWIVLPVDDGSEAYLEWVTEQSSAEPR
ncbi:divalent-cation tolerance protein CutA [Streptomyces sp. NPDC047315]|uniref:divalent-cation tolerance protein CutA n=1 Tax=Streptomyces sp. NPDC047315 TaxID=3155142 RepID=UPI003405EBF2